MERLLLWCPLAATLLIDLTVALSTVWQVAH